MNLEKLKQTEQNFLRRYPGGFAHPEMMEISKKHKPEKMFDMAIDRFRIENFSDSQGIVETMIKVINSSSMVSLFEKPKFRDFANHLDDD